MQSIRASRFIMSFCFCISLFLQAGCQPTAVPVSDIDSSKILLQNTLELWKDGKSVADARGMSTPIYVSDELWSSGVSLKAYELLDQGEQWGTNARFIVELTIIEKTGRNSKKKVSYLVTTTPANSIAREDR